MPTISASATVDFKKRLLTTYLDLTAIKTPRPRFKASVRKT